MVTIILQLTFSSAYGYQFLSVLYKISLSCTTTSNSLSTLYSTFVVRELRDVSPVRVPLVTNVLKIAIQPMVLLAKVGLLWTIYMNIINITQLNAMQYTLLQFDATRLNAVK